MTEIDKFGAEVHPAFGMIGASRVSASHGQVLFDSDVQHQHFVILRVKRANRKRDLHRDWIHDDSKDIVEVAMSEAQWASMISSMNTSGVPCTIRYTEKDGVIPGLDFESRLDKTHQEVRESAQKALEEVQEALELVKEKPNKTNVRNLDIKMGNLPSNMEFAAKSLTKHAEAVVQKTRADIEAMTMAAAERAGVALPRYQELESGQETKELEDGD